MSRSLAVLALLAALLLGCGGQPDTLEEKAEAVGSIAAEGSLLAHSAGRGESFGSFTKEHARALRDRLAEVEPLIDDPDLEEVSGDVDSALLRLEETPSDRATAHAVEQELDDAAKAAEKIGKAA